MIPSIGTRPLKPTFSGLVQKRAPGAVTPRNQVQSGCILQCLYYSKKKRVWIVSIGKWTARTCSPISVDDCQTANKIQYCYCKTDRCNSPMTNENQTTTTTTTSTTTTEPAADISSGAGKKSFFYIWLAICLLILVSK